MQNSDLLVPVSIQLVDGPRIKKVLDKKFESNTELSAIEQQLRQLLNLEPQNGIQFTIGGQRNPHHIKLSQISSQMKQTKEILISIKVQY
ncbi:unnamed protein product [Paramecium octaurelia]|uniref:Ubiquitin-like domain-containing protein n=1 Tax=Paramecium octaurelia TaxID=43137 RepID=A0A8S1W629_PAROT|nr:unnamed protein product [Paramecium octaurelia]